MRFLGLASSRGGADWLSGHSLLFSVIRQILSWVQPITPLQAQVELARRRNRSRLTHRRIRGTGGCYGLHALSEAAAVLDDMLTAMKRGQGGSWPEADAAAELVRSVILAASRNVG